MAAFAHGLIDALVVCTGLLLPLAKRQWMAILWTLCAATLLLVAIAHAGKIILHGLAAPQMWDFYCFWLYGRVADVLHTPYDPHAFHSLAAGLTYDASFAREILDVGFVYAPPTVVLFAPLGVFHSPDAALPYWYALLIAACCIDAVLLWKIFFSAERWRGPIIAVLLIALLPATMTVLQLTQTLFIALAFVLLYLADRNVWRKGMWLALAAIVKPFLLLLFLYVLVRRRWAPLAAGALTVAATALMALPIIGFLSFQSFVMHPPSGRLPDWTITEPANQSLLAMLLRAMHASVTVTQAPHQLLYLVLAGAVLALTVTAVLRAGAGAEQYCICLLIAAALVVYPATLYHYTVLLLLPIALLWSRRNILPAGFWIPFAVTAIVFTLAAAENRQFYAFTFTWLILIALQPLLAADRPPRPAAEVPLTSSPSPA